MGSNGLNEQASANGFCRDCFANVADDARRCGQCGSPRLVRDAEIETLALAHIDCDAFYASVEKRDHPEWRDRPVIVGGGKRGVVSTACYIARTYGVRSAMPMFKAKAACPHAVVVAPDMAKYARVARSLRAMMTELTPLVEPLSIDEAFLDLSGTRRLHGAAPAITLARFARRVEAELGLSVSIGLSYCKSWRRSPPISTSREALRCWDGASDKLSGRQAGLADLGRRRCRP